MWSSKREGVIGLKQIRLLQCGDLHLDAPFTSLADRSGKPGQRRQELRRALARIVELAESEQADLLLVCGDLYEHGYLRKNTFTFICEQFRKIPGIPVLITPGNHDPASPDSFYSVGTWPDNVHLLADAGSAYRHPPTGTLVHGGLPPDGISNDGEIHIVMLHGTLDMPFSTDAWQPVSSSKIDASGADYCALGHFHSVIRGAGRKKLVYNAGSPEPLGFDEEGEHGVFITTVSRMPSGESHIEAEFKRLNQRRYIGLEVRPEGCHTDEQLAAAIAASMKAAGSSEDLYGIVIRGIAGHGYQPDTGFITEQLEQLAFYVKISDQSSPDYDFRQIAEEPGLRGLFTRKMLDKAADAADEEERRLILKALYYGIEAIDEGSVCI